MGFKVILTPQSVSDLETITKFIAKDNPERARTFGNQLIDHALSVGSLPERGRIVPEIGDHAVREIIHGLSYHLRNFPRIQIDFCPALLAWRPGKAGH